ncbi:MAG: hypothetical protein Q8S12_00445 [Hydrogenophaga sp.]|uniref:hypothetical protein n=1 Tax=Hydrogenophaga sp. TaxID=1904254 RepID=UPI0027334AFC|nr:hypothetical protein [Hydrogenophaga sp.]MDP3625035.1 hypothetical protein [Hydrogenophaga sp.]
MVRIIWFLPVIGALISSLIVLVTLSAGASAPQEAAGYAMACAFSVVPYVLAKSIMGMTDQAWQADIKRMATALEKRARTNPQGEERASTSR